jgi:outer membrane protein assembly factor BamB
VRRVPIVVLAVLTAMVMTAVFLKWHAARAHPGVTTVQAGLVPDRPGSPAVLGLGAGPPPLDVPVASHGARMLHGDAHHTNRAGSRVRTSGPSVAWVRDVGGPVEAQITASPDEQTLYAASLGGTLSALDRADGSVRWALPLGDRIYSTPLVADDGSIYRESDAKKFVAVSPEGKIKWSLDTDGDADSGATMSSDGAVVFAAGRTVYAVTPAGYVRWRFSAKRKVFTSPAVGPRGRIFFGAQDHHVYALEADGRLAWSVDLGADVDGGPAIDDGGHLFVGTDGDEVVRLDPDDGKIAWRANLGGYVRGTLSVARNGDVLAGVYGPRPRAVRLRPDDGGVRGDFAIQGTGARDFGVHGGAMEDAGGTLVFGAQDDAVYAVGARGNLLWRFEVGGDVDAPATLLSDGTLVVGSDDGSVRAFRPAG